MNYKIENFIGIFDNVLSDASCQSMIAYFENMEQRNLVVNSKLYSDVKANNRKDDSVFMFEPRVFQLHPTHMCLDAFTNAFWPCYEKYLEEFPALYAAAKHGILGLRVQKTVPGGGFHNWHFETGEYAHASRIITMMVYLNDVEEGGETEFLYQHQRVQAKAGRLLIWPSGFTHTHRGNPPLDGVKYIVTGWLNLLE